MLRGYADTSLGQVHYRRAGAGPALVLLHDSTGTSRMFVEVASHLAPGFHVIAIDTPGYGDSDWLNGPVGLDGYARAVVEVMDDLAVGRAAVLGHGVGAAIALQIAAGYPQRVDALLQSDMPDAASLAADPSPSRADGQHMDAAWGRVSELLPADASVLLKHRTTIDTLKAGPNVHFADRAVAAVDLGALRATVAAPILAVPGVKAMIADPTAFATAVADLLARTGTS